MIHIASREATSLGTQASQDATVSPDDHSEREPPDPMPNSEVKPLSADGSVEFLHVRVGHRQALIPNRPCSLAAGAVLFVRRKSCDQERMRLEQFFLARVAEGRPTTVIKARQALVPHRPCRLAAGAVLSVAVHRGCKAP